MHFPFTLDNQTLSTVTLTPVVPIRRRSAVFRLFTFGRVHEKELLHGRHVRLLPHIHLARLGNMGTGVHLLVHVVGHAVLDVSVLRQHDVARHLEGDLGQPLGQEVILGGRGGLHLVLRHGEDLVAFDCPALVDVIVLVPNTNA